MRLTIGIVWIVILGLLGLGLIFLLKDRSPEPASLVEEEVVIGEVAPFVSQTQIGSSVEGRPIEVFTFGIGSRHILFVGGIHGGYEWNSVLLAYAVTDYFTENPDQVPKDATIAIIPSLNPDGLYRVIQKEGRFGAVDINQSVDIATGRFNANNVDLNRNFDCKWAPESTWRGNVVSAGTGAFSEPETVALRDYVEQTSPEAVIFWHSQANAVYASECEEGILPSTLRLMDTYATASGYTPISTFDAYPITGDAEGWLASIGIPAITVELETRSSIEWQQNLLGVQAVIQAFFTTLLN